MAKKISAKERREQKQLKAEQYRQIDAKKQNLKAEVQIAERKAASSQTGVKSKSDKTKRKSAVKANGLKSVFVIGDKVQMTSFGRGNKAIIEKELVENDIRELTSDPVFDAANLGKNIEISRRGVHLEKKGLAESKYEIRKDVIMGKDELETRYFGHPMDDNIHIQLAYQILDLEKILSVYIDNIIYSLGNVLKPEGEDAYDLIGDIGEKTFDTFKNDYRYSVFQTMYNNERLRYFGRAFYDSGYDKKASKTVKGKDGKSQERSKKRSEEDCYHILSLLGRVRQFTKHGKKKGKERTWLYSLDRVLTEKDKRVLDDIYEDRLNHLNNDFVKNSIKDLTIAAEALGRNTLDEKKELVKEYYGFVVLKNGRNMGFSIKKLREILIDNFVPDLRKDSYNSVRSKLYKMIDFIIYTFYTTDEGKHAADRLVDELRCSLDDGEKDVIYTGHVGHLWERCKDSINKVITGMGQITSNRFNVDQDLKNLKIEESGLNPSQITYFSKLMYMMSLFLDGKEINDLLTSLINKFENIQSFEDVIKEDGLESIKKGKGSEYDYSFLSDAGRLADEIRSVKSVARMELPLPNAKATLLEDALKLFWIDDKETAKKIVSGENKKVRNFIANNVVESSRFSYIVRYTALENAREFIHCRPIVEFVLNKVPETQIERYWKSCGCEDENKSYTTKGKRGWIADITDKLISLDASVFTGGNIEDAVEKERKKALVSLYLTVIYQVIKGLVFVNSKYTIAIHSLERDTKLILDKDIFGDEDSVKYSELFAMSDRYIIEREKELEKRKDENKRARYHTINAIKNSRAAIGDLNDDDIKKAYYHICRLYRNSIAHLNAVTYAHCYIGKFSERYRVSSYFALYHFFMQEYLMNHEKFANPKFCITNSEVKKWADKVEEYRGYNRDWLWSLNAPFAYNPSRYKSLSIEDLFYKDPDAVISVTDKKEER